MSVFGVDMASLGTTIVYVLVIVAAAAFAHSTARDTFMVAARTNIGKFPFFPLGFEFLCAAALALLLFVDPGTLSAHARAAYHIVVIAVVVLLALGLIFVAFDFYEAEPASDFFVPGGFLCVSIVVCNFLYFERFVQ